MHTQLAFIGTTELLLIGGMALLLFGGKKLPEMMRGLGQGVKEFKDGMKEGNEKGAEGGQEEMPESPSNPTPSPEGVTSPERQEQSVKVQPDDEAK